MKFLKKTIICLFLTLSFVFAVVLGSKKVNAEEYTLVDYTGYTLGFTFDGPIQNDTELHSYLLDFFDYYASSSDDYGYYIELDDEFISNGITFNYLEITYLDYISDSYPYLSIRYQNNDSVIDVYNSFVGWNESYKDIKILNTTPFGDTIYNALVDYNLLEIISNGKITISGWYRFTSVNSIVLPTNFNTGYYDVKFLTSYIIPNDYLDYNSADSIKGSRQSFNKVYIQTYELAYTYDYNGNYSIFTAFDEEGWGGPYSSNKNNQDQIIFFERQEVTESFYEFLLLNGFFGTTNEVHYDDDTTEFGSLISAVAFVPITLLQSFLDVSILGVSLFSVFCAIMTIAVIVFVLKKVL